MLRKLFLVSLLAGVCLPAHAAPCMTLTTACMEWVNLGTGQSRSLIYRTYALGQFNDKITRALIVVHGAGRDADNYFRTALAATFLAEALDDTIVISPRFASNNGAGCTDVLQPNELNWRCNGDSWRSGGTATNDEKLTSYDFADEIIRRLARKDVFPNLRAIVVCGHSAGGQFVTRYEMANQIHEKAGIPVTYVVANPSSYAYLDSDRPDQEEFAQFEIIIVKLSGREISAGTVTVLRRDADEGRARAMELGDLLASAAGSNLRFQSAEPPPAAHD